MKLCELVSVRVLVLSFVRVIVLVSELVELLKV